MSVTVSLTFDTDQPKATVLADVMETIRNHARLQPTSTHAYTDDDLNGGEVVHLVAAEDPTGAVSSVVAFIGRAKANAAHAWAEEMGGVVVELPVDTDCRNGDQR